MRTRCANGLRSPQVVHGAMGPEGTNWRVVKQVSGHTGRVDALDRLHSGLGGRQGCARREAPGAGSSLQPDCDGHLERQEIDR
eukprot:scaffold73816_cov45-Phaeocystis_antarctica.AAC.1